LKISDRATAYEFVKTRLIYYSPLEINRLVDQLLSLYLPVRETIIHIGNLKHIKNKNRARIALYPSSANFELRRVAHCLLPLAFADRAAHCAIAAPLEAGGPRSRGALGSESAQPQP
jgi:hypothetical protein